MAVLASSRIAWQDVRWRWVLAFQAVMPENTPVVVLRNGCIPSMCKGIDAM